jgi:protein tyrosine phosphatase (PTP) superfamily phosphohydrolase (DUF442 family)
MRTTMGGMLAALITVLFVGCQQQPGPAATLTPAPAAVPGASQSTEGETADTAPAAARPEKLDVKFLPNAYRLHEKVISGGQPAGEPAFAELAALGVKTVISVDGAKPDVEAAKKHGLRYVHLPHGYDGVPEARVQELAKAVRELPGPIYIHCHHGKHRSPAAATVACVAAGLVVPAQADGILRVAGTSPSYEGLYESARAARKLEAKLLDELQVEFPETAKIPPLAESMVGLEHTHDHLKTIDAGGWRPLPEHPDLKPAHEALLLREHFTEMARSEPVMAEPESFRTMLTESGVAAKELEDLLGKDGFGDDPADAKQATAILARVSANCKACHTQYRDVPLGKKNGAAK